jgi:hypothetical protein
VIAVHDFTGMRTHQVFVDSVLADQAAWCAPEGDAPVVGLARREPAVDRRQHTAVSGRFVGQLRPNRTYRGVRHGTAECPPTHALFHRGHIQVLDNDVAVAARW